MKIVNKCNNGRIQVIKENDVLVAVALKCETDFLSKSDLFINSLDEICKCFITNDNDKKQQIIEELKEKFL